MGLSSLFGLAPAAISKVGSSFADSEKKKQDLAKQTAAENKAASEAQARQAEMASNKANAKTPSFDTAMNRIMMNAKNGGSGTMLTGSSGAATGLLGKTTLLGG